MTSPSHSPAPPSVVGVQFQPAGLIHEYDGGGLDLARGDRVVVEVPRATALATVARPPYASSDPLLHPPRVLRRADEHDLAREDQNRVREDEAFRLCLARIRARQMSMK